MRSAGLAQINFGTELTTADKARALSLNEAWDRHRRGPPEAVSVILRRYPEGSVGAGYLRAMALRETERRNKGIVWSSEQRSRDDWPRAWKWIAGSKLIEPRQAAKRLPLCHAERSNCSLHI